MNNWIKAILITFGIAAVCATLLWLLIQFPLQVLIATFALFFISMFTLIAFMIKTALDVRQ